MELDKNKTHSVDDRPVVMRAGLVMMRAGLVQLDHPTNMFAPSLLLSFVFCYDYTIKLAANPKSFHFVRKYKDR